MPRSIGREEKQRLNGQGNEAGGSLVSLIQCIVDDLNDADPGTRAELRRLTPDDPGGPAFWRIVVRHLDRELPVGDQRDQALRQWAAILRALAQLHALHNSSHRLGTVLAEADISELRVNKLLRTSGDRLFDQVRAVSHQLVSAGVSVDVTGFARLVLSDDKPNERAIRQGIANDYYQVTFNTEKEKQPT
jgi:CRISPR type I-E-associated protein CasB/Cse2